MSGRAAGVALPRAAVSGSRRRAASRAGERKAPRPSRRFLVVVTVLAIVLAAAYVWFRDSGFVAAEKVTVSGAGGDEELVAALKGEAVEMSTLHFDAGRLAEVAARFGNVDAVTVKADFPHTLGVTVSLRDAVGYVESSDGKFVAASDGTLSPAEQIPQGLPPLQLEAEPGAGTVGADDLELLRVIKAAPQKLTPLISGGALSHDNGPVLTLGDGIELRFGDDSQARAKWIAAAAVLADPEVTTLSYIDLTSPSRPAAGGAPVPVIADPAEAQYEP